MYAIPTTYAGVNFRSRLEARWAAYFDLTSMPWRYEPIDLAGYIPDFIVGVGGLTLVEIKPSLRCEDLYAHTSKIDASGWWDSDQPRRARLLGADPEIGLFKCPMLELNWCVDEYALNGDHKWREAGNRVQWKRPR